MPACGVRRDALARGGAIRPGVAQPQGLVLARGRDDTRFKLTADNAEDADNTPSAIGVFCVIRGQIPSASSRPARKRGPYGNALDDPERVTQVGMMATNRDEVIFNVKRRSYWLSVGTPGFVAAFASVVLWNKTSEQWGVIIAGVVGVVGCVVFALTIKPVDSPVVVIRDDGVLLYPNRGEPRLIPWTMISDVEFRAVRRDDGFVSERRNAFALVFRLMALKWAYVLPTGAPSGEDIAAAIRARIRPEVAANVDRLDAPAFFETVFGIQLPVTTTVVHEEFHPADKSGLWSVRMNQDEFLKLKTTAGAVSAWFPLTRDQRFEVGGRRLVGTVDLAGEYAISRQEWDATPVLVWDSANGVLHGMLTRSVM